MPITSSNADANAETDARANANATLIYDAARLGRRRNQI